MPVSPGCRQAKGPLAYLIGKERGRERPGFPPILASTTPHSPILMQCPGEDPHTLVTEPVIVPDA